MKLYISKSTSPYFNLPMEELLARHLEKEEDIVFLYQHDNAIIVGRNQNTNQEINLEVVKKNKIEIARRISGGGAVYHDLGNVNFSFITNRKDGKNYQEFLKPIEAFLKSLGLDAKFKGRNDLVVNDAKISGNAQFILENSICHHGTLLFDVDLSKLSKVLIPNKLKMESKGIKSIRQRVTNIKEELRKINVDMSSNIFLEKLADFFISSGYQFNELPETEFKNELSELKNIRSSEEWIFGKNPEFKVSNEAKYDGGILKIQYNVKSNKFLNIVFEGDFLSSKNVQELEEKIVGMEYKKSVFSDFLDSIDFSDYFGKIQKKEVLDLIF